MPLVPSVSTPSRLTFQGSLNAAEIAEIAADRSVECLQTPSAVDDYTLDLLNEALFPIRPDIEMRVYGYYGETCDLAFVRKLSNVRRFTANCILSGSGFEHLTSLKELEALSLGFFNLKSFEFLADVEPEHLTSLSLEATESKKLSLGQLSRFHNLKELYIEGHQKEIDTISTLASLEDLTLRSVSCPTLEFVRELKHLWSLDIKLGGIRDLSDLTEMHQIKYLELWQIKGLENIDVISTLCGLQFLFLQSLTNVTCLPNLSRLTSLRRIYMESMKRLQDVSNIATAPALTEFIHTASQGLQPADYSPIFQSKSLRHAGVWFGSEKKNQEFAELAAAHGVSEYKRTNFVFV